MQLIVLFRYIVHNELNGYITEWIHINFVFIIKPENFQHGCSTRSYMYKYYIIITQYNDNYREIIYSIILYIIKE